MSARPPLDVWIYGTRAARLDESRGDRIELTWTDDARERWGEGPSVVSHLLPIGSRAQQPRPVRVRAFLDGLLPEGNARVNYALDAGLRSEDTYGMVSRYGRDTAGALVFQPIDEPEPIKVGEYVPITDDEVRQRLLDADRHSPTDPHRGIESISLAGMQPKIGLHRIAGHWQACLSGAPSTWIVKLAHPTTSPVADVVDTEVLALDLARHIGITSIRAEILAFGDVRAIAVPRYDRIEDATGLKRIHQEDLAQALGINTSDPNRKFQRGSAIPSLQSAADVLNQGGSEPDDLLRLATFNLLIGNTDAHAKNISFLRLADGSVKLAPAYDVAMHLHHDVRDHLSAMDINGKYRLVDIAIADLFAEGRSWGLSPVVCRRLVEATASALAAALEGIDRSTYPGVTDRAFAVVSRRVRGAARDGYASDRHM
jgi:serine/threonine-protein kinase HipA